MYILKEELGKFLDKRLQGAKFILVNDQGDIDPSLLKTAVNDSIPVFGDVIGRAITGVIIGVLKAAADNGIHSHIADSYKRQLDAFIASGFTREEAFQLIQGLRQQIMDSFRNISSGVSVRRSE